MIKLVEQEKKKEHALAQERYTQKKMQTHQRMGIWVPKKHVSTQFSPREIKNLPLAIRN